MLIEILIIFIFFRERKKKITKKVMFLGILIYAVIIGTIFYLIPYLFPLNISTLPYSTVIYDSNGTEIGEGLGVRYSGGEKKLRHRPTEYFQLSGFLIDTIIAIEDQRFWRHNGFDKKGFIRAIKHNFQAKSIVEGGSTISSQVIRNNYRLTKKRTILRKISEFYLARALNFQYSKKEILTIYCDRLYFGYLNYGFSSASHWYFDKELKNLTNAEKFALIIISKNASRYNPIQFPSNFEKRFEIVAKTLKTRGIRTNKQYEQISSEKLFWNKHHKNKLPYVINHIKKSKISKNQNILSGKLHTTIDYNLTKIIENFVYQTILDLQWKSVGDYGILVIDRETKEIKVMIGGVDYDGIEGQVNSVFAMNQAGSTMKPFTYLLAFEELGKKPSDKILDAPVQFKNNMGFAYNPKNFSLAYLGSVSLAKALASSLNVPAIKLAKKIGVKNLLDFYHKLGFSGLNKGTDYYGLALTLGVGEVSLYELVRAFGIFAFDGELCEFSIISLLKNPHLNPFYDPLLNPPPSGEDFELRLTPLSAGDGLGVRFMGEIEKRGEIKCKVISNKKYTKMIEEILSDRYAKLYGFPINSNLDFPNIFVVKKSGTSRNFSDNWVVGYIDRYLIGVRVGNKDGKQMKGVSGSSGAGDIFKKIVIYLNKIAEKAEKNNKNRQNQINSNLTKIDLSDISDSLSDLSVQITSPLDGSIYQTDLTIPTSSQQIKLEFMTNINYTDYEWFVDGKKHNQEFVQLQTGTFDIRLDLIDNGNVIESQESSFMVK